MNCVAVGVRKRGEDKDAVASVGRSASRSWNKHRLDGISATLKISADALEGEGLTQAVSVNSVHLSEYIGLASHISEYPAFDHSGDASNIFANNPARLDFVNSSQHLRPEVAVIVCPPPVYLRRKKAGREILP